MTIQFHFIQSFVLLRKGIAKSRADAGCSLRTSEEYAHFLKTPEKNKETRMVAVLSFLTAILLLTTSKASRDLQDSSIDPDNTIGAFAFNSDYKSRTDDCPCLLSNSMAVTQEANCGWSNITTIPDCIPDTVTVLSLAGSQQLTLQPRLFERFKALRKLNLWNSNLDNLGNYSFVGLSNLEELDLGVNHLDELGYNSFHGLSNLRTLSLHWNAIKMIGQDSFKGLQNLRFLDLSWNKITHIEGDAFAELTKLRVLNLSNPSMAQTVHFSPQSFHGLSSLEYLHLQNIGVFNGTSFPPGIFEPLINLKELDLYRFCRTHHMMDDHCPNLHEQIGDIPSLERLYLDAERITQLGPGFRSLINLREIEFLAVLDIQITNLSNKTFENLENSPISKIALYGSSETFGDIQIHRSFTFREVQIDKVMPNTFAALKNLQFLDLSFASELVQM